MGLGIALRAFTASLFNRDVAECLRDAMDEIKQNGLVPKPPNLPPPSTTSDKPTSPVQAASARSEAVSLLSVLQREARLVDLIQEDLTQFSDAQVGAAARPCLTACAKTLARIMSLTPVDNSGEGASVSVPPDAAARYQWVGEPQGDAGTLIHQGWSTTAPQLPAWTGDDADANVIAAAQVKA